MKRRYPTIVLTGLLMASAACGRESPPRTVVEAARETRPLAQTSTQTAPCNPGSSVKLLAPSSGAYHSMFPWFATPTRWEDYVDIPRLQSYESQAQKAVAWAVFSNNWGYTDSRGSHLRIVFPRDDALAIWSYGRIPYIRMLPWTRQEQWDGRSGTYRDPIVTLRKIVDGRFDTKLRAWFDAATTLRDAQGRPVPLLITFAPEMNGTWFPWSGYWNGKTAGSYKQAYRRIIGIARAEAAKPGHVNNITWFFHPNNDSVPATSWNRIAAYYPGGMYIDWIGTSAYGAQVSGDDWESFLTAMDDAYRRISALDPVKPLGVLEFGVRQELRRTEDKPAWIHAAFRAIKTRYPRIRAAVWWQEGWENGRGEPDTDLSILSPQAPWTTESPLQAYLDEVNSPDAYFTSTPTYACS